MKIYLQPKHLLGIACLQVARQSPFKQGVMASNLPKGPYCQ